MTQKGKRMKEKAPEELLANWSCYEGTPDTVIERLNVLGCALIAAIRREGPDIQYAMDCLQAAQRRFAMYGAEDTEGREAIWELVQAACVGTLFDPKELWEECYE